MDIWRGDAVEAILASIDECVLGLDRAGHIRLALRGERLPCLVADPLGRHFSEALPEVAAQEVSRALQELGGGAASQRLSFVLPVGEETRRYRGTLGAVRLEQQWLGTLLIFFEVGSELLLTQDRDREAMAQLEKARGQAEAANRAKSQFLAAMSHALRTPLHGILGMAELLQQTHLGDHQREYLDAIRERGRVLHSLLNDLQDLNKIESGGLDLRSVPFDLVEAVEGLTDMLGAEAASHGTQLCCQVAPELPTVMVGDPDRLRQVLVNLLGVAMRCCTRGEIRLTARRGEQNRVLFEMVLGGRVFSPMSRPGGDAGSALALSIARGLLAHMGSELLGEFREGGVLRFELALGTAPQSSSSEHFPLRACRVLLGLANAEERLRLRDALEQAGAEVELSSGGVEVIRTLRDDPHFSCTVLDAALPDIDGGSVAALIRARAELAQIPILLVCSADDQPLPGVELNGQLSKPVPPSLLVRAVSMVMARGRIDPESLGGGQDRTVLLVEDNEVNLRLARDMLRRAGYRVVGARTGAEALANLDRYSIDAVLMDIQLPDMDGLEATARIRSLPAGARVPIIAMTAHAMKGDAERFMQAGLDDYLSKPVNQGELLQALARAIRRRQATASR